LKLGAFRSRAKTAIDQSVVHSGVHGDVGPNKASLLVIDRLVVAGKLLDLAGRQHGLRGWLGVVLLTIGSLLQSATLGSRHLGNSGSASTHLIGAAGSGHLLDLIGAESRRRRGRRIAARGLHKGVHGSRVAGKILPELLAEASLEGFLKGAGGGGEEGHKSDA
jgi:hypothetical protein